MSLFEELCPGDVVWALMPLSEEELSAIEESHRIRPYLVVGKDDNAIYAYQSSSKKQKFANNYQTYNINQMKLGYSRNSNIDLTCLRKLPEENLLKIMQHLSEQELSLIAKKLKIQSNHGKKINYSFDVPVQVCEGDVVSIDSDNMYYVYGSEKNKLLCYPISVFEHENWDEIEIDETLYYIDFNNQEIISDSSMLKIIDTASVAESNIIQAQKHKKGKASKAKIRKKDVYELGSIFNTNKGKMMYLYRRNNKDYAVNLNTYRIVPETIPISNLSSDDVVEVYSMDKVKDVVKFLYNFMKFPCKELADIYQELR